MRPQTRLLARILVTIAIWQVVVAILRPPAYLLPAPGAVRKAVADNPQPFWANTITTLIEICAGLGLAVGGAVAWAALLVSASSVRRATFPLLVALQSIPKEAFAPILILWLGFSVLPKVILAAVMAFLPLLIATMVGLERFTTGQRHLITSMGAGPLTVLTKVRFWVALPAFASGVRTAVAFTATGTVVA